MAELIVKCNVTLLTATIKMEGSNLRLHEWLAILNFFRTDLMGNAHTT